MSIAEFGLLPDTCARTIEAMSSKAAAELGRKRWDGISKEERRRLMSAAVKARWEATTPEQRRAHALKLVEARRRKKAAV